MRNRRPTSWLLGFAGSAMAHLCVLAAVFAFGSGNRRDGRSGGETTSEAIALTSVDQAFAVVDPLAAAIPVDIVAPARAWDAPEGDRDNLAALTTAPSDSDGRRRLAPAPDQGDTGGHPPDHAYRRDNSTLRSRLTDGAMEAQPAHTRTSGRLASPQAIRREPVVGIGDAVRTVVPRRAPSPLVSAASTTAMAGPTGAGPTEAPAEAPAASEPPPPVPSAELAALTVPARASGPLDAEQGARSFDTERPGKAADDDTLRAASNEHHPGLTDFTRPAAPATTAGSDGRGPGARAGAVARPASGAAPSELGAPNRDAAAAEVNERARARRYQRFELEIRQRVNRVLEFPKPLALRMEQGITIVYFVVGADGRVSEGPRVVKSSGFDEFDSAAVRAVRRAAPFPPMPVVMPMSMSVIFDNPVIR
jgi:TonB family protein